MHVPTDKRRKLDAKAIEVTLVGFEPEAKGYKLWDSQTCSIHLSRDVTFNESSFPSRKGSNLAPTPAPVVSTPLSTIPVVAAPHLPAPSPPRAPSPVSSHSSEEDVKLLLDPTQQERPHMPPPHTPSPPHTPQRPPQHFHLTTQPSTCYAHCAHPS